MFHCIYISKTVDYFQNINSTFSSDENKILTYSYLQKLVFFQELDFCGLE